MSEASHGSDCKEVSLANFGELKSMLEVAARASTTLIRAVWFIIGLSVMATMGYASLVNRVSDIERYGSPNLKTLVQTEQVSRDKLTETLNELDKTLRLLQADQKYQDRRIEQLEQKL